MTIDRCARASLAPIVLALALFAGACSSTPEADGPAPEAVTLLGEPLYAPELPPERRAELEADLAVAMALLADDPTDEEEIVWVGRRLAYLGRYREAIEVFSRGLEVHPQSYRLLRHRGHRWITVREFDQAVEDLTRAVWRSREAPDAIEADGAPNALGIPRGTDKTSIHYHLGLAHYLRGEFAAALAAYDECRALSPNDDMSVAADYWRYLCLRRLGRADEAAALLATVRREMDVIENHDYHALLLFYRGAIGERELLSGLEAGVASATLLYGYGTWWLVEGDARRARAVYELALDGAAWPAFGYIAAEAEIARARR